jgi:hypothetical protein
VSLVVDMLLSFNLRLSLLGSSLGLQFSIFFEGGALISLLLLLLRILIGLGVSYEFASTLRNFSLLLLSLLISLLFTPYVVFT